MGYSTQVIDSKIALHLVKNNKCSVDSASDASLFEKFPKLNDVLSACKSDHGHIIFSLRQGHFVDYKLG